MRLCLGKWEMVKRERVDQKLFVEDDKVHLKQLFTVKSFRFGVDCAKCLADCVLVCAER